MRNEAVSLKSHTAMLRIAVGTSADLAGSALLRTTGERAPAGLHAAYHPHWSVQ